jgi:hypothetical protein
LNARNQVERANEEDDKTLSLGMSMHPKEKEMKSKRKSGGRME